MTTVQPDDADRARIDALVDTARDRLAAAYVLDATADDETGKREADDVCRSVTDALVNLAADNPRLLAEMVICLLDQPARRDARQIVHGMRLAQECLDDAATIPVDMRARRTP